MPINGEPHITSNGVSIGQDWSENRKLGDIIDSSGNFRDLDRIDDNRRPFEYEYSELRKTLKDFLDIYSGGRLGANSCRPGVPDNIDESFNVYGRLVTKRKKGCSHFSWFTERACKKGWVDHVRFETKDYLYNEGID